MTILPEIPDPNIVLEMEPEDLAPVILRYLQKKQQSGEQINRYNFSLLNDPRIYEHMPGPKAERYAERLMEGWMWLEREGFIAPKPGTQDGWSFVTQRGMAIV